MSPSLTYAVGDVHGRFDLLEEALRLIAAHAAGAPRRIVFLGDYIDRGPQSAQVIERLIGLQRAGGVTCLKGNHEALMIEALSGGGRTEMARWATNGGGATLASYAQAGRSPAAHLSWLNRLPLTTADRHRLYVHAGLAPHVAIDRQKEATLLWIREAFLKARPAAFPSHVVHGHTPLWAGKPDPARPELLAHRTNLDTGAYATGRLTIGVFLADRPGGPAELLTARGPEADGG